MGMRKITARRGENRRTPLWRLAYLEVAEKEARRFLNDEQYEHAVQLFDELAFESHPTQSQTQSVKPIREFYELRDKGGVLGKINLRVYFTVFKERGVIVVLSTYKKEDEGRPPDHIVTRVRNRLRRAKVLLEQGDNI